MLIESTDADAQINFKDVNSGDGVSIGVRGDDFYIRTGLSTERLRVKSNGDVTLSGTGSLKVPVGTTGERPTPAAGMFRYNSTEGKFEGYTTEWGEIGGGGLGFTTAAHVANNAVVTLDLTAAQDHKVTATGIVRLLVLVVQKQPVIRLELSTADQQQLVSALTSCSHQVTHQYYHQQMEQSILYRLQSIE